MNQNRIRKSLRGFFSNRTFSFMYRGHYCRWIHLSETLVLNPKKLPEARNLKPQLRHRFRECWEELGTSILCLFPFWKSSRIERPLRKTKRGPAGRVNTVNASSCRTSPRRNENRLPSSSIRVRDPSLSEREGARSRVLLNPSSSFNLVF